MFQVFRLLFQLRESFLPFSNEILQVCALFPEPDHEIALKSQIFEESGKFP